MRKIQLSNVNKTYFDCLITGTGRHPLTVVIIGHVVDDVLMIRPNLCPS